MAAIWLCTHTLIDRHLHSLGSTLTQWKDGASFASRAASLSAAILRVSQLRHWLVGNGTDSAQPTRFNAGSAFLAAIVKVAGEPQQLTRTYSSHHAEHAKHAHTPQRSQLDRLVLAVADDVPAVALRICESMNAGDQGA